MVGLAGYLSYDKLVLDKNTKNDLEASREDLEIANREKKEANDKVKDLEKDAKETSNVEEKNYFTENFDNNAKDIHVYSISSSARDIIYAYNGEMYIAYDNYGKSDSDNYSSMHIFTSKNPTKTSKEYNTKIKKLNIKENEVNKVLSFNYFETTDASYVSYVVYKNGKVLSIINGEDSRYVFKDYKVSDIRVSCKKSAKIAGCEVIDYKLTLQDGTTKTVTEK